MRLQRALNPICAQVQRPQAAVLSSNNDDLQAASRILSLLHDMPPGLRQHCTQIAVYLCALGVMYAKFTRTWSDMNVIQSPRFSSSKVPAMSPSSETLCAVTYAMQGGHGGCSLSKRHHCTYYTTAKPKMSHLLAQ